MVRDINVLSLEIVVAGRKELYEENQTVGRKTEVNCVNWFPPMAGG